MKTVCVCLSLLLSFTTATAAPFSGYKLDITMTTTSDWCQLKLITPHKLAVLDYAILRNDSPNAQIHILSINQPGNTAMIEVSYEAFLQDPVETELVFESTKGDWGEVRVVIAGFQNGLLTTVKEFTNTKVTGDPTNTKTFSIPAVDVTSLDHVNLDGSGQDVPHTLFAFYYPWYGSPEGPTGSWFHWNPSNHYDSTHEPLLGYYDSAEPAVQDQHLQWAQEIGVDVLICSWWGIGSFEDRRFVELLQQAELSPVKLTVYFENNSEMENAGPDERPAIVEKHLRHVLNRYAPEPAFFRYDGKPVIFLYGLPLSRLSFDQWQQVVTDLRNEGFDFFISADSYDLAYIKLFDGFHTYNPLYHTQMELQQLFDNNLLTSLYHKKIYAATILPGYDDTIILEPGIQVSREDGRFYQMQWDVVEQVQPRWVLITSWNEWHEGSEIEPSVEYDSRYLELTLAGHNVWDPDPAKVDSVSDAQSFLVFSVYPNPFNSNVRLQFDTAQAGRAMINIYNVVGQPVRTLWEGQLAEGKQLIQWNGLDENGTSVASGVYLVRVELLSQVWNLKLVCLR